jgi:hypothetical protein
MKTKKDCNTCVNLVKTSGTNVKDGIFCSVFHLDPYKILNEGYCVYWEGVKTGIDE